jgi:C-terminal processing protease CtpA/Prc
MNKKILILFVLYFQIGFSNNKITETQKLFTTAKVWGFLKYYHPNVANGSKDWDEELFKIMPKVKKAQSEETYSKVIEDWIITLGEVDKKSIVEGAKEDYFDKNFNLSWINNDLLISKSLSKRLRFIEENRYHGTPFYIDTTEAGNIFLKNEKFSDLNWSDENYRLLTLFRYWNIIEYFFPYKYLMDNSWDKTLQDMLPDFVLTKSEDDFKVAMHKLTVRLNDSHSSFYYSTSQTNGKTRRFLPVKCVIIDKEMVVSEIMSDTLAKLDDIQIGDVITKVNNKTIEQIITEKRDLVSASNEASYLRNLVFEITTGYKDSIDLEGRRNSAVFKKVIQWTDYNKSHSNELKRKKSEKYKLIDDNIGYVYMGKIYEKEVPEMMSKLNSTKAIILDMRDYPNGTNFEIAKYLNSDVKPFVKYTKPDLSYPGRFIWSKPRFCGTKNANSYKGKIVVLVNELSQSQSEWATMCFQTADNATVIGSQTAGADGNTSSINITNKHEAPFSGIGVYYPDGTETQRVGIIPDIIVKPTVLGIQNKKDEVLERAVLFINEGK